jgi:hypothetical protein
LQELQSRAQGTLEQQRARLLEFQRANPDLPPFPIPESRPPEQSAHWGLSFWDPATQCAVAGPPPGRAPTQEQVYWRGLHREWLQREFFVCALPWPDLASPGAADDARPSLRRCRWRRSGRRWRRTSRSSGGPTAWRSCRPRRARGSEARAGVSSHHHLQDSGLCCPRRRGPRQRAQTALAMHRA